MSMNVIELFPRGAAPVMAPPTYQLKWSTARGPQWMHTADRDVIIRQLTSLLKGGIMAMVTKDGDKCGGIMAVTQADGAQQFQAHLDGESWGVY